METKEFQELPKVDLQKINGGRNAVSMNDNPIYVSSGSGQNPLYGE